jgi:chloramphenicol O-acetyltransferase
MYLIFVSAEALARAQELASAGVGGEWHVLDTEVTTHYPVATTQPERFLELEEQLRIQNQGGR